MLASLDFKGCRRKGLPIFMSGADHAFQAHLKGRRHFPRQRHRVTNWREYDVSLRNRGMPALRREIQASPSCFNGGKPKVATRIFVEHGCFGLKVYFPSLRLPWRTLAQPLRNSLENRPITFWLRHSGRMRLTSSHSRELCRQHWAPWPAAAMVPSGANLFFPKCFSEIDGTISITASLEKRRRWTGRRGAKLTTLNGAIDFRFFCVLLA